VETYFESSFTVQSVFAQGTAEKLTYRGSETMYAPVQIESISLRVWWSRGGIKDPSGVIRELNLNTSTASIRCSSKESRGRGYSARLCYIGSCLNAHGACCKTYSIWPLALSHPLPFYPSTSSPLTLHMIWKAAHPHPTQADPHRTH